MTQVIKEKPAPRIFINPQGYKVAENKMKPQEILRDEVVIEHIAMAIKLSAEVEAFKRKVFGDINDYIALIAAEYNTEINTGKGNFTLASFDGKSKIVIGISDDIKFGPEIDIAKKLINEVVEEIMADSDNELLMRVINDAFQTNKQGNYSKAGIYVLRKYRSANKSQKWQDAMRALDDGIIAGSTKTYLRFYKKNAWGKDILIPLASTSL